MVELKNVKQTKYMSVTLNINAAAAVGIYSSAAAGLDDSYDVCDGVAITELTDGTIADGNYDISIQGSIGTPIDFTQIDVVQVNGNTPVNDRFVDVLFDAKAGKNMKLMAQLPAIPAAAMVIKATFRLRRLLTPITVPNV